MSGEGDIVSPLSAASGGGGNITAEGGDVDSKALNVPGIISIAVFYLAVLLVGLWAGWRQRKQARERGQDGSDQEEVMLAGRNIGLFVGILTMGATWVGGGFINGSAEETYKAGLIWTQAPVGYGLSLFISGTFFARKMREARYVTMIDPFTQKYGKWGALQALPSAMSEIFWSASILGALGSTLEVILHINTETSIIISAIIAVFYTLFGGLISVAYTDVFQLFFIAFGLFLALPYALNNEAVGSIDVGTTDWIGEVQSQDWGVWIDYAFLLLLGGIPWQCYYQRVLSSKTATRAQMLSYGGGLIALIMTVPSVLFGAIAKATRWEETDWGSAPKGTDTKLVLPLCLQYLTPTAVAFFGLGAISAAVMSSTDSSMLSASTMLARNVYKTVFRPKASEGEVLKVLWVLILINCTIATVMAITYQSVYNLFVLCGDFVFVMVFPQLLLVIYYSKSNTYGSVWGFVISLFLRLMCGDSLMNIPPAISFGEICYLQEVKEMKEEEPVFFAKQTPCEVLEEGSCMYKCGAVPFRLIVMLITLLTQAFVSWLTDYLFTNQKVDLQYDFLDVFTYTSNGAVRPKRDRNLNDEMSMDELKHRNGH